MKTEKELELINLALSEEKTTVSEIKNRIVEILMDDVMPMDLIRIISDHKTRWAKEPLRPNVKPGRFSITEALRNEGNKK